MFGVVKSARFQYDTNGRLLFFVREQEQVSDGRAHDSGWRYKWEVACDD